MAASDVFVTFGGDTGALEAATAAVKSQMASLSREMRKVADEFNKAGAVADSELGKKLKALGADMAAARSHLGDFKTAAEKGGDAIKQMAERIGDAAYEYGPWTGTHVQLAQAIGETLARGFSSAGVAATAFAGALGVVSVAAGVSLAVVGAQVQSLRDLDDAARAAKISMAALRDLNTAAMAVGVDASQMNQEMAGFAQKLREAQVSGGDLADFLKANNIAIKDAHGALLPVQQVFGKIAELILSSNNEMDRLAALSKLGFSADTLRLIERQTDAVKVFANSSKSAQDEVLKQGLKDGEALSAAWSGAWADIKGVALSASVAVLGSIGEIEHRGAAEFSQLANEAAAAFARITGDARGAAAAAANAFAAQRNEVLRQEAMAVSGGKSPFGALNVNAFGAPKASAPPSDQPTIKGLYDDGKSGAKKKHGGGDNSAARLAQEDARDETAAAKATFDAEKGLIDEKAKLHIISAQEQIAETRRALDTEFSDEKATLQKELQLQSLKPEQRKAINSQIEQLERQHQAAMQKLQFRQAEDELKNWNSMIDAMSGSFSSGVMGMINGTTTLRQALASVASSVTQQFVRMGVEMAANWAKGELAQVALANTAEAQKTAAAAAGAAARGGIASGEASSGLGAIISNAFKSIAVSAGEAGAGAAAFSAPFIGPAAVAEGLAVKAAVLGFSLPGYDIGAWQIDQDQIAMVHRNEMVMPAAEAGAFRSMLSGAANGGGSAGAGGGGNTHVHLNVSALDAGSVKSWLSNNSRQIMKALDGAVRNGDHLGLRRLATS